MGTTGESYPLNPRKGQTQVFDGLRWGLAGIALIGAAGGALTPTRLPVMGSSGLIDSRLTETGTGPFALSYAGTVTVAAGTTLVNTTVGATGSIADFLQFDIKNASSGTGAQGGFSATADTGTSTTLFAWMGINNSGTPLVSQYNIGAALDTSFIGAGNDMYVWNSSTTKDMIFALGKVASPYYDEFLRIKRSNNSIIATVPGGLTSIQAATQDAVRILGRAGGTSSFVASITPTTLTASRTYTLPDADITLTGSTVALINGRVALIAAGGLLIDNAKYKYEAGTFFTDGFILGDGTSNTGFTICGAGPANSSVGLQFCRGGATSAFRRWFNGTDTAEAGSDTGGRIFWNAYTDAGVLIDTPLAITRVAGGLMTLTRPVSITSSTDATSSIAASVMLTGGLAVAKGLFVGTFTRTATLGFGTTTDSSTGATPALAIPTTFIRSTGAALDLQGIAAPAAALGASIIHVYFTSATTIRNLSGSASAANRITTGTGADIAASALSVYAFLYDPTSTTWRIT